VSDVLGVICLALTVALVAPGMVIFLSGNDLALLPIIVGFGVFVTAIGFFAAARSAR